MAPPVAPPPLLAGPRPGFDTRSRAWYGLCRTRSEANQLTQQATQQWRVLVVGYSQTGQLDSILESLVAPLAESASIKVTWLRPEPATPLPFPWPFGQFFDTFPECVYEEPIPIEEPPISADARFDLIIFGYQVWFLAPSMPAMALLQHPKAQGWFHDTPVVSVIGCRNMWLSAQETVKRRIRGLGGRLVDNVVFTDDAPSAATFVSTPVWVLTGNRGPFLGGLIPAAGVAQRDIDGARRFGSAIVDHLPRRSPSARTPMLAGLGAVEINERMIASERIARRSFHIWGALLRRLGPAGTPLRRTALAVYVAFLTTLILTVVPITALVKRAMAPLMRERIARQRAYYAAPSGESRNPSERVV